MFISLIIALPITALIGIFLPNIIYGISWLDFHNFTTDKAFLNTEKAINFMKNNGIPINDNTQQYIHDRMFVCIIAIIAIFFLTFIIALIIKEFAIKKRIRNKK